MQYVKFDSVNVLDWFSACCSGESQIANKLGFFM